MFEEKKRQLQADKRALAAAKEKYMKYIELSKTAKNSGMKSINAAKANELGMLIDIIDRRCKELSK